MILQTTFSPSRIAFRLVCFVINEPPTGMRTPFMLSHPSFQIITESDVDVRAIRTLQYIVYNSCSNHQNGAGHPFFRSYGARLPSSLTRFHSRALAQLCPPTCVGLRYGQPWEHLVVFLDTSFNRSASAEASTSLLLRADRHFQPTACLYSYVTTKLNHSRCRNIKPAIHRLRPSAST